MLSKKDRNEAQNNAAQIPWKMISVKVIFSDFRENEVS
jgi:hypothetical protein